MLCFAEDGADLHRPSTFGSGFHSAVPVGESVFRFNGGRSGARPPLPSGSQLLLRRTGIRAWEMDRYAVPQCFLKTTITFTMLSHHSVFPIDNYCFFFLANL